MSSPTNRYPPGASEPALMDRREERARVRGAPGNSDTSVDAQLKDVIYSRAASSRRAMTPTPPNPIDSPNRSMPPGSRQPSLRDDPV